MHFPDTPSWRVARRVVAIVILAWFGYERYQERHLYASQVMWTLETGLYVILIMNYVRRMDAVSPAQGWMENVYPFFCSALPFAMMWAPVNRAVMSTPWMFETGKWIVLLGDLITFVSMLTLGRSFGITVAARKAVTGGVYRFIRHPVYVGEMIAVAGVTIWRFSPLGVAAFLTFVICQCYRAILEERKLSETFPEYREYVQRTGRFFPRGC
ncbi:MAG: isoprenylcysteine carboxylmethyltransferase family protein [Armatimonadetes bacterium]|nr:isoprenylcysteine carboxylmethyltransferase family protein [Armatimonadota bacterium]